MLNLSVGTMPLTSLVESIDACSHEGFSSSRVDCCSRNCPKSSVGKGGARANLDVQSNTLSSLPSLKPSFFDSLSLSHRNFMRPEEGGGPRHRQQQQPSPPAGRLAQRSCVLAQWSWPETGTRQAAWPCSRRHRTSCDTLE
jgi:hypothetical protein